MAKQRATKAQQPTMFIAASVLGLTVGLLVGVSQTPAVGPLISGFFGLVGGGAIALMAREQDDKVRFTADEANRLGWALICFCILSLVSVCLGGCIRVRVTKPASISSRTDKPADPVMCAKLALLQRQLAGAGVDVTTNNELIELLINDYHAEHDKAVKDVGVALEALIERDRRTNDLLRILNANRDYILAADTMKWKTLAGDSRCAGLGIYLPEPVTEDTPIAAVRVIDEFVQYEKRISAEWDVLQRHVFSTLVTAEGKLERIKAFALNIPDSTGEYWVPCGAPSPEESVLPDWGSGKPKQPPAAPAQRF